MARSTIRWTLALLAILGCFPTGSGAESLRVDRVLHGASAGGGFGSACIVPGDLRGNGHYDFAITAPDEGVGGAVYFFEAPNDSVPAWVVTGEPGDRLGSSLGFADVDGDLRMDLVIGAPGDPSSDPAAPGRVVIAFGPSGPGTRPLESIPGTQPGGRFGAAVAGLYDANRRYPHGPNRFAVGAPDADSGAGEVLIFEGGSALGTTPQQVLRGRHAGDHFGAALARAGWSHPPLGTTPDSSRSSDLVVGAPENSESGDGVGRAYVFFGGRYPFGGSAWLDSLPGAQWAGEHAGDHFGASVAGGGDVNFDGYDDVLVGAPQSMVGELSEAGRAYLFPGRAIPALTAAVVVDGSSAGARCGEGLSLFGDTFEPNGFAIGSPGAPGAGIPGQVRVYPARPIPTPVPDTTLTGLTPDDGFGTSISQRGSIRWCYLCQWTPPSNDFLIGAPRDGAGSAYLLADPPETDAVDSEKRPAIARLTAQPNPFHGAVRLRLEVASPGAVHLDVVDISGRVVARLVDGAVAAGAHEFVWAPARSRANSRVSPGVYWAVLSSRGHRLARELVMIH